MQTYGPNIEAEVKIYPMEMGVRHLAKIPKYDTVKRISKIFDANPDISSQTITASLNCPISKRRMKFACRSSSCGHIQPFDAQVFLQMNQDKEDWMCPICGNHLGNSMLQLDEYFMEIISNNPDLERISFDEKGGYFRSSNDEKAKVLDLTEDAQKHVKIGNVAGNNTEEIITIDLTEDNADSQEGASNSAETVGEENNDPNSRVKNSIKRKSNKMTKSVLKKRNVGAEISVCVIKSSNADVNLDETDFHAIDDEIMDRYVDGGHKFQYDLACLQRERNFIKLYCKESFGLVKQNIGQIQAPAGKGDYHYEMIPLKYYMVKIPIRIFKEADKLVKFIRSFNKDLDTTYDDRKAFSLYFCCLSLKFDVLSY